MKIVHIFAPESGSEVGEGLWAVEYDGRAIKLTHRMQDRPHTHEQLHKLRTVRDWLKEQGIYFSEDLTNLL